MNPVFLFGFAKQQLQYLNARQIAVTQNIVNSSTPGYKTLDVRPFSDVMNARQQVMFTSSAGHMTPSGRSSDIYRQILASSPETHVSGNNVNLDNEMLRAGEIRRAYNVNTAVVKAFHKMSLMSVKG
ncbi:MAG: flagellar basal body rod protein FlgB [Beijerinckiaceae bacterium]